MKKRRLSYRHSKSFLMLQAEVMGIIGAFQFAGHDLFALPFVQRLFIPADVLKQSGGIIFSI